MTKRRTDRIDDLQILFTGELMSIEHVSYDKELKKFKKGAYQPGIKFVENSLQIDDYANDMKILLYNIANIVVRIKYTYFNKPKNTICKLEYIKSNSNGSRSEICILSPKYAELKTQRELFYTNLRNAVITLRDYDGQFYNITNGIFDIIIKDDKFFEENDDVILINEDNYMISIDEENEDNIIISGRGEYNGTKW